MKTVILDGTDTYSQISDALKEYYEGKEHVFFRLKDMNILPCRSCGSCGHKTPGECVIKDDMSKILKKIASCDIVVFLTSITFGGYSATLKKAVDRFMVMGLPLYMVKDGHLLHPMRYGSKFLVVIGLAEEEAYGQEKSFRTLAANNSLNLGCKYHTLILKPTDNKKTIWREIDRAFEEAAQS